MIGCEVEKIQGTAEARLMPASRPLDDIRILCNLYDEASPFGVILHENAVVTRRVRPSAFAELRINAPEVMRTIHDAVQLRDHVIRPSFRRSITIGSSSDR